MLAQHLRVEQFRSLVKERTQDFVGREFVFKAIQDFLEGSSNSDFKSGYVVIRGEPGIGKTALASQLVKRYGYLHHFNIVTQNIRSPRDFLADICAQLVVRYQLSHGALPSSATQDSGFLSQLLGEAVEVARARDLLPIVIVVDALDEAEDTGLAAGANRLFLPAAVPEGVFFILTTREKEEYRLSVDRRRDIYINDRGEQNLADVRLYIETFFNQFREKMMARLIEWRITEDEMLNAVTEKSQGNFMYLVHVLRDIRDGHLTPTNLDSIYDLPVGLKEYYKRHWRFMREQDAPRFRDYFEPVVCILASAQEPVPVSQLVAWTQSRWPHLETTSIREVIRVWREFLDEERPGQGPPLYRIYHTSFRDFLREEVGLTPYHDAIVLTALNKIPGFFGSANLPM